MGRDAPSMRQRATECRHDDKLSDVRFENPTSRLWYRSVFIQSPEFFRLSAQSPYLVGSPRCLPVGGWYAILNGWQAIALQRLVLILFAD
jgi:hypothetical protein